MKQTLLRYLPILLLAFAWEAAARLGLGSALALPPPSAVLVAFVDLVRDGDVIELDVPGRTLNVLLSEEELGRRRAAWRRPV